MRPPTSAPPAYCRKASALGKPRARKPFELRRSSIAARSPASSSTISTKVVRFRLAMGPLATPPKDAALEARLDRIGAISRGCFDGCHGLIQLFHQVHQTGDIGATHSC